VHTICKKTKKKKFTTPANPTGQEPQHSSFELAVASLTSDPFNPVPCLKVHVELGGDGGEGGGGDGGFFLPQPVSLTIELSREAWKSVNWLIILANNAGISPF
jgi:hypothetical protein